MESFREWSKFSVKVRKLGAKLRRNPEEAKSDLEEVEKEFNDLVKDTKIKLGE